MSDIGMFKIKKGYKIIILLSLLLFIRNSVVFAGYYSTDSSQDTDSTYYNNIGNNVNDYPLMPPLNNNYNNCKPSNNYTIYNTNNYPIYIYNNNNKNVNNYPPMPQYKNENDISNNQNQKVIDINASYDHNNNNDNNKEDACAPVPGLLETQVQTNNNITSDDVESRYKFLQKELISSRINSNGQSQKYKAIDTVKKICGKLIKGDKLVGLFINVFVSGLGGYNNTWKPILNSERWYFYRNEFLNHIALGINYRIYSQFNIPYVNHKVDVDLHIIGFNILTITMCYILMMVLFQGVWESWKNATKYLHFFDLEIAVCKYYSISLNIGAMIFNYYILRR